MMYEVVQSFPKTPQSFTGDGGDVVEKTILKRTSLNVFSFSFFCPAVAPSIVSPPVKPWGRDVEILVLGTVSCASVVFLFLTVIICYKAIKR